MNTKQLKTYLYFSAVTIFIGLANYLWVNNVLEGSENFDLIREALPSFMSLKVYAYMVLSVLIFGMSFLIRIIRLNNNASRYLAIIFLLLNLGLMLPFLGFVVDKV